jgi:hypothetical protein
MDMVCFQLYLDWADLADDRAATGSIEEAFDISNIPLCVPKTSSRVDDVMESPRLAE